MSIEISVYQATGITAEFCENGGTYWVQLRFPTYNRFTKQKSDGDFEVCLFLTNRETAKAYADAINSAEFVKASRAEAVTVVESVLAILPGGGDAA
jgi:hypothetical protein